MCRKRREAIFTHLLFHRILHREDTHPRKHETFTRFCFNIVPPSTVLAQHQANIGSKYLVLCEVYTTQREERQEHSQHDTLTHCWVNVGPSSATIAQHRPSIVSEYRVWWDIGRLQFCFSCLPGIWDSIQTFGFPSRHPVGRIMKTCRFLSGNKTAVCRLSW